MNGDAVHTIEMCIVGVDIESFNSDELQHHAAFKLIRLTTFSFFLALWPHWVSDYECGCEKLVVVVILMQRFDLWRRVADCIISRRWLKYFSSSRS